MKFYVKPVGFLQVQKAISDIGRVQARSAVSRALKRTQTTMAKTGSKQIREKRFIKLNAGAAKKRIFNRGRFSGPINSMKAEIVFANKAENLANFFARRVTPPRGKAKHSRIKIGADHLDVKLMAVQVTVFGRTQLAAKGAGFMVSRPGGNLIFHRTGNKRLPIKKMYGPSFADFFNRTGEGTILASRSRERFVEVMEQELAFRLGRSGAK